MIIGLLKEWLPEKRVALLPEAVSALVKQGYDVVIEQAAGEFAFASDEAYREIGAKIADRQTVCFSADLLISIHPPSNEDLAQVKVGTALISLFKPLQHPDLVQLLQEGGLSAFSLDLLPRTTRAQAMDTLSSMATVAGYKAVLTAAMHLPTFFPMFMTAAGTITPAKVLILGAGVAGLQAIATSRKLGAVVHVFDVRAAVKEEVMSLGGKFVEVEGAKDDSSAGGYAVTQQEDYVIRQKKAIHDQAVKSDVIICTAQIPGRAAPLLIEEATVQSMKPGSVIIDLAASTGGNCAITQNNAIIEKYMVTVVGDSNLPASMPVDASRMFGKNVLNFLKLMLHDEGMQFNFDDDILLNTCICHEGEVVSPRLVEITAS